jgi:hypothetical protein
MTGGIIQPINLWHARQSFVATEGKAISGGWSNITGIGPVLATKMVAGGPYRTWGDVQKVMPAAMYDKVRRSGLTGDEPLDTQMVAYLMPWLPIPATMLTHAAYRDRFSVGQPGHLPDEEQRDVVIAGYVTATHKKSRTGSFKGDQIVYAIEDETGWAIARVANKHLGTLGVRCKEMRVGDYVAVSGWWSGDTLFIRDFQVIAKWDGGKRRKP